jgi:hypothetical protein
MKLRQNTAVLGTSHEIRKVIVYNLKPEWWGAPLVQEEYEEKGDL